MRAEWARVKALLEEKIAATEPGAWFERHTSIPAEDFAREPHRNKLNVLLSRTTHLDYHLGQLVLLKGR